MNSRRTPARPACPIRRRRSGSSRRDSIAPASAASSPVGRHQQPGTSRGSTTSSVPWNVRGDHGALGRHRLQRGQRAVPPSRTRSRRDRSSNRDSLFHAARPGADDDADASVLGALNASIRPPPVRRPTSRSTTFGCRSRTSANGVHEHVVLLDRIEARHAADHVRVAQTRASLSRVWRARVQLVGRRCRSRRPSMRSARATPRPQRFVLLRRGHVDHRVRDTPPAIARAPDRALTGARIALVVDPVKRVDRRHVGRATRPADRRGRRPCRACAPVGTRITNDPLDGSERQRERSKRVDGDFGRASIPSAWRSAANRWSDGPATETLELVGGEVTDRVQDLARAAAERGGGQELQHANHIPIVAAARAPTRFAKRG